LGVLRAQENPAQFFPLAAGLAAVETHGGANAASAEKPRLGLSSLRTASHLGFAVCNSTTALGLRAGWIENRGGAYRWARYYNSLTGRFLSRDPNEGTPFIPAMLHKYLYVGGDPVNRIDPRGRELGEEAELDERSLTQSVRYAAEQLKTTTKLLRTAIETLKQANTFAGNPDIWISVWGSTLGNVYLQIWEDEQFSYEFLDNLFNYLP
jgi:RHS repeat-associated protein